METVGVDIGHFVSLQFVMEFLSRRGFGARSWVNGWAGDWPSLESLKAVFAKLNALL